MKKRILIAALAALVLTAASPTLTMAAAPEPVVMPAGAMRASKVLGLKVYTEQGEAFGALDEVVFTNDGKEPTAILSVGTFLGVGPKLIAVPLSHVHLSGKPTMAGATKVFLRAQADYTYGSG